jgi:hypothetical protein
MYVHYSAISNHRKLLTRPKEVGIFIGLCIEKFLPSQRLLNMAKEVKVSKYQI